MQIDPQTLPLPAAPRPESPILVVDDDCGVRTLLEIGLRRLGYQVAAVSDIAEARERMRRYPHSLVLCDYEMPGGSGLELLEYVSRVYPDLPFIMLTGHVSLPLAREAIASGALDFLCKPFEIREMARLIEQNWERLRRERQRTSQLINDMLTGTIRALVAAVDAKDPYTASHSERVTRLSMRTAGALGLPPDRLRVLEIAALLHDVGKIGVPERILTKPAALSTEEWAILKEHPIRSAEIVGQVCHLSEVATIVRHHHERLDGDGYPDGLAGEAIPDLSRVIAVCDVYEALTSDRAYRRALGPPAARDLIAGRLGTHLDPRIGEVFLSLEQLP